jgi:hypothetical protein
MLCAQLQHATDDGASPVGQNSLPVFVVPCCSLQHVDKAPSTHKDIPGAKSCTIKSKYPVEKCTGVVWNPANISEWQAPLPNVHELVQCMLGLHCTACCLELRMLACGNTVHSGTDST